MIQKHISLKPYNTFGIDVTADFFADFTSLEELKSLLITTKGKDLLVLGGGSNMLLTKNFEGCILRNQIKGIEKVKDNEIELFLKVGGGEVWHDFVLYTVDQNFGGLENLSLIPGSVGASPIQNIGAYGAEIKDCFVNLEALNLKTMEVEVFDREKCAFGYRDSVFKNKLKGQYIILSVTFRLSKKPEINTSYGIIKQTLDDMGVQKPTVKDVSNAVIAIRQSKLPDPKEIGNSGSFFKNPEIPIEQFEALRKKYPTIVGYPVSDNITKVPAGWLIDQAGWKGKTFGDVGVHKKQALVLVNYNNGTGQEVLDLARKIQESVFDVYGITIEPEVNII